MIVPDIGQGLNSSHIRDEYFSCKNIIKCNFFSWRVSFKILYSRICVNDYKM